MNLSSPAGKKSECKAILIDAMALKIRLIMKMSGVQFATQTAGAQNTVVKLVVERTTSEIRLLFTVLALL